MISETIGVASRVQLSIHERTDVGDGGHSISAVIAATSSS